MSFTLLFSYLFHFFPVPVPISFHDVCCHWQWLEWSRCWNIDFLSLPSCVFFFFPSPRSLSHTSFSLCLSVSHSLSYPPPRHWYQRSLCWLIALLSATFPTPFVFISLSPWCLVSLFTGLPILSSVSFRLFLLRSWALFFSRQTPLFQPGADEGMYTQKSHSVCLKWQHFWHAEDSSQDGMSGRIISEAQDQSSQTEFRMIFAVPTVQTVIKSVPLAYHRLKR